MVSGIQETNVEERARMALHLILSQGRLLNEFRDDTVQAIHQKLREFDVTFSEGSLDARASGISLTYQSKNKTRILSRISMQGKFNDTPLAITVERYFPSDVETIQPS